MNTAIAAEVVKACIGQVKNPDWGRLGALITKHVDRGATNIEEIAERVIAEYKHGEPDVE